MRRQTWPVRLAAAVMLAALAWGAPPSRAEGAAVEVRIVDLEKVFEQYIKKQQAEAALKEQAERFNLERQELVKQGQQLNEEFNQLREESQNTALSEEKRGEKRIEAEDKLRELKDFETRLKSFDEEKRRLLDEQSKRMRRTLVKEIRDELKVYARKEGFALVIDVSGSTLNMEPVVLFADERLDITDQLVERLNLPETIRR